jgi:hypothetical protein
MRTNNVINEACARELVGKSFLGGMFVSYETRNGKITLTAKCNQCGGPHSGISVTNADQAVRNPNSRLINCQHCTYVMPTPAKQTYEEIISRIPERERTSAQDRIVAEHEFAVRKAQAERVKQAPVIAARAEANRAVKAAVWTGHERLLLAIAKTVGASSIDDPRVRQHSDYQTFEQWQEVPEEDRAKANQVVDNCLASYGIQ